MDIIPSGGNGWDRSRRRPFPRRAPLEAPKKRDKNPSSQDKEPTDTDVEQKDQRTYGLAGLLLLLFAVIFAVRLRKGFAKPDRSRSSDLPTAAE